MSVNPLVRWRSNLVRDLGGAVLEIGVGKGENLPYYRRANCVAAIEPDLHRAEHARRRAAGADVRAMVLVARAEALPFVDTNFDHVVSSLVFCSVMDPQHALEEIRRVLCNRGSLHMVEHVRPTVPWLARLFTLLTPGWRRVACNCHLDRPTLDLLQHNGWSLTLHWRRSVLVRLTARPHSARLF